MAPSSGSPRGWAPLVWINGSILPAAEARVSVFDRGLLLGDGVYETLLLRHGRLFRWREHEQRLWQSLSLARISLPLASAALAEAILACASANGLKEARVRLTVTRGEGGPGFERLAGAAPCVIIALGQAPPVPSETLREGVAAVVARIRQTGRDNLDPALKSISRIHLALARMEAEEAGAREAILLGSDGVLREGTASNLFMVRAGKLQTPSLECGILQGVTRGVVLELAENRRIAWEEGRYGTEELHAAEEVFLTNTSWGVLPVGRLDGRSVGTGRSGPIALHLAAAIQELVDSECGGAQP
ncbi:MAG TPA: aminotransferase class IV [Candidatus Polarisedimenticolia bacterium]|nr:aminotransferase class IV [Candidatus Polarisedimenticolia bacterium]